MLLLNVFTLNKNNERLTRELLPLTGDLVTLGDEAPSGVGSLLSGIQMARSGCGTYK